MTLRIQVVLMMLLGGWVPAAAGAQAGDSAAAQPAAQEERQLAGRVGLWDVVTTFRFAPDSAPTVTRGVVAERKMVGLYLEEVMRPAPGSAPPDFRRISYLTYAATEGRWQYVSLDTRLPVGIMPAVSFGRETERTLRLQFEPMGFVGFGGRMMRSNLVITRDADDRDRAQQYWVAADGTGREWLAVQYDYRRKR